MNNDPYKVLGLDSTASMDEVTKTYRKLAKKYHPDLNPNDPVAAKRMSEINAAYDRIKSGDTNPGYNQGYNPYGNAYQSRQNNPYESVLAYLSAGYFNEALNVLESITTRDGQWFYYSAYAHYQTGNKMQALSHIRAAVQMEPYNQTYQQLLYQIENNAHIYTNRRSSYGMPMINISSCCYYYFISQLLCNCCFPGRIC